MESDRLKSDLTALAMVKHVMVNYAVNLLDRKGVFASLKNPNTLEAISKECGLRHKKMLENMLDLLVGEGILAFGEGKYSLKGPTGTDITEAKRFLSGAYKESLEWIDFVNQFSDKTLTTGVASELTGFEAEKAIYYWNKIMEQGPFSLRVLAITELYKGLGAGALVLDYGCGSGVGLEQLLELSNKPLQLIGTDPSNKFFSDAKRRIQGLAFGDSVRSTNKANLVFEDFKNLDRYEGKLDAIFISIIFNHIAQAEHIAVFRKLNALLKPGGKLVIVQLIDFGKHNRNPIWVMHNIPSHKGYPMREQFVNDLRTVFGKVDERLDGMITISTK